MFPKYSAVQIMSSNVYSTFLLAVKFPVRAILNSPLSPMDNYKNEKQKSKRNMQGISSSYGKKARLAPKPFGSLLLSFWPCISQADEKVKRTGRILTPDALIQRRGSWTYWVSKDPANNHQRTRSLKICYKLDLLGVYYWKDTLNGMFSSQVTNLLRLTKFPMGEDEGTLLLKSEAKKRTLLPVSRAAPSSWSATECLGSRGMEPGWEVFPWTTDSSWMVLCLTRHEILQEHLHLWNACHSLYSTVATSDEHELQNRIGHKC